MNIGSVPPELYYYGHSPIKPWVIEAYAEVYFTYSENMPDRYRTVPSRRRRHARDRRLCRRLVLWGERRHLQSVA